MFRRLIFLAAVVAGLLVFAPTAGAATGGCELQGTAGFAQGLNADMKPFAYSFHGDLTNCQSSEAGSPATGTVSAGEAVTIGGQQFQEPVAVGNGGCASSTTAGTAIVTWADGGKTVVEYRTTGAAAAVGLQGTVVPAVTLDAINPAPGQPTETTVTTTRYGGATAAGLLTFQPPDPTACNTPAGVSSAGISGFIGLNG